MNVLHCFEGVWNEYRICKKEELLIFDFDIEYEKICFALGNPLTACAFLETLRNMNVKAVIQNGSSGAFGRMFCKLCVKENMEVIILSEKIHI